MSKNVGRLERLVRESTTPFGTCGQTNSTSVVDRQGQLLFTYRQQSDYPMVTDSPLVDTCWALSITSFIKEPRNSYQVNPLVTWEVLGGLLICGLMPICINTFSGISLRSSFHKTSLRITNQHRMNRQHARPSNMVKLSQSFLGLIQTRTRSADSFENFTMAFPTIIELGCPTKMESPDFHSFSTLPMTHSTRIQI